MNPINPDRHQIKVAIFALWLAIKEAEEAPQTLESNNFQKVPSYSTFMRYFNEFRKGILRSSDSVRAGRPRTVEDANKVKQIILKNRKISVKNLSKITGITGGLIRNLVIKKLQGNKLHSIKDPQRLTPELKTERLEWCQEMLKKYSDHENMDSIVIGDEIYLFFEQVHGGKEVRFEDEDYPSREPKMNHYTQKKRVFHLFFNRKGVVHVSYGRSYRAQTGRSYRAQIERRYRAQIGKVVEKVGGDPCRITIHDNAPTHRGILMENYYNKSGVQRVIHPHYSADLAPNNLWLIRKLKCAMENMHIKGERRLYLETVKTLKSLPDTEYTRCFDVWVDKMRTCVANGGDYFEYRE